MRTPNTLWLSEVFDSIQGEGPLMGQPATFIRTAYCNLHCTWCDAWYTWDHKRIDVKANSYAVNTQTYKPEMKRIVILTGGEPLLQQEALFQFIRTNPNHDYQFETNGTIIPNSSAMTFRPVYYVVSPKLLNNQADSKRQRIRDVPMKWFRNNSAYFKFVIKNPSDLKEVGRILLDYDIHARRVWLMPEGRSSEELDRVAPFVADECKRQGYNYSDRLQIRLWGDKRGT